MAQTVCFHEQLWDQRHEASVLDGRRRRLNSTCDPPLSPVPAVSLTFIISTAAAELLLRTVPNTSSVKAAGERRLTASVITPLKFRKLFLPATVSGGGGGHGRVKPIT